MSKILTLIAILIMVLVIPVQTSQRVLVTADHLGDISGYTKVYSDTSSDYGVYIKDDYKSNACKEGDHVRFAGTRGQVASSKNTEFTVKVENISKIVPGVSGSPVYKGGKAVGFISGWNGDGLLRCIYY